jgi:hypothetical protein
MSPQVEIVLRAPLHSADVCLGVWQFSSGELDHFPSSQERGFF